MSEDSRKPSQKTGGKSPANGLNNVPPPMTDILKDTSQCKMIFYDDIGHACSDLLDLNKNNTDDSDLYSPRLNNNMTSCDNAVFAVSPDKDLISFDDSLSDEDSTIVSSVAPSVDKHSQTTQHGDDISIISNDTVVSYSSGIDCSFSTSMRSTSRGTSITSMDDEQTIHETSFDSALSWDPDPLENIVSDNTDTCIQKQVAIFLNYTTDMALHRHLDMNNSSKGPPGGPAGGRHPKEHGFVNHDEVKAYPLIDMGMQEHPTQFENTDAGSQSPASSSSDDGLHGNTEPAEGEESEDESSGPENGSDSTSNYSTDVNAIQDHIDRSNLALLKQELQLTVNERDTLKDELQKTRNKLDQYTCMDGFRSEVNEGNNYDWLKVQWEGTMSELQVVKRQHTETVKKCDLTTKEADFYRAKYKSLHEKLKQTAIEGQTQYSQQCCENERLKQEVKDLQARLEVNEEEIKQLHSQQREVISRPGSSEVLNKMYDTTLDRYEATKRDYEKLRKRHQELITSHSEAVTRLEFLQKDIEMLKKQNEDITKKKKVPTATLR